MEAATHTEISLIHTGPLSVNTFIVTDGGQYALIVDPASSAFTGDETVVTDFLSRRALEPAAVVLTHGHFDHVAALPYLRSRFASLPVAIHKADSVYLGQGSAMQRRSLAAIGFLEFEDSVAALPEASDFLKDGCTLWECVQGVPSGAKRLLSAWRVMHTPGHTEGSVCLYNEAESLLLSGDTVFFRSWGRTDLPGGNERTMQKTLRMLYRTLPLHTKVFPGHDETGFVLSQNL